MRNLDRPKILFVGAFPPNGSQIYGGMVTSCSALMQSSLPSRADLILVDSTQVAHPPPGLFVRLLLAARRFAEYVRKLEQHRPDAVIMFAAAGASVAEKGAMAWYAKLRRTPALLFPRGGPVIDACRQSRFTRAWTRLAFQGASAILCQGPVWRDFAVDEMRILRQNTHIISNWTASPPLLAVGRSRSRRPGVPHILFVGWLDREKGVEELLQACAELDARSFSMTFVGEGNMSDIARNYVASHGMADATHFLGWLSSEELGEVYASADIFVLPSWSEGLPNAMIEAMAAGCAIVATRVGNIPTAVTDGESALLVEPHEPASLRIALSRLIESQALRDAIGKNALVEAEKRFSVEPAVDRLLAVVDNVRKQAGGQR